MVGDRAVVDPRGGGDRVGLGAAGRGGRRGDRRALRRAGEGELLDACRAVGEALGIEVLPRAVVRRADGLHRRSDELGALARASGFHTRPVTLREGWWRSRRRAAPGLARRRRRPRAPVALLPAVRRRPWAAHSYEVRMPDGRRPPRRREIAAGSPRRPGCSTGRCPDRPPRDASTSSASAGAWRAGAGAGAGPRAGVRRRPARPVDPDRRRASSWTG